MSGFILHYSLKSSGFLVLGSSESVSAFPELFSRVDKKHKIYAKRVIVSRLHYDFAQSYYPPQSTVRISANALKSQSADKDELDVQAEADRVVLREHASVGVVINREMEVVQFRGHTAPYLAPPPGRPSVNVLKLARNGLAIEVRALITAATKKGGTARKDGVAFDENGHKRMLNQRPRCLLGADGRQSGSNPSPNIHTGDTRDRASRGNGYRRGRRERSHLPHGTGFCCVAWYLKADSSDAILMTPG